eukprot:superscaffoldBa00000233_g2984
MTVIGVLFKAASGAITFCLDSAGADLTASERAALLLHRQPAEESHQSELVDPRTRNTPTGIRAGEERGAAFTASRRLPPHTPHHPCAREDEGIWEVWTLRTAARSGKRDLVEKLAFAAAVPELRTLAVNVELQDQPTVLTIAQVAQREQLIRPQSVRNRRVLVSGGELLDSFSQRRRPPFCWTACKRRMLSESESGLAALRLASSSRGMTALWCSLCLSFLLPLCVTPARLPTAQPT